MESFACSITSGSHKGKPICICPGIYTPTLCRHQRSSVSVCNIYKVLRLFVCRNMPPARADSLYRAITQVAKVTEGATGVRTVEKVNAEEAEAIFNLAGQRLQKPQRGINIINGRKVVVK